MKRINSIKNASLAESEANKSIIFVPQSSPKVIVLDDSDDEEENVSFYKDPVECFQTNIFFINREELSIIMRSLTFG